MLTEQLVLRHLDLFVHIQRQESIISIIVKVVVRTFYYCANTRSSLEGVARGIMNIAECIHQ